MRQMKEIDYDILVRDVSRNYYSLANWADNDLRKLQEGTQKDLIFVRLFIEILNYDIVNVKKPITIDSFPDLEKCSVMKQVFNLYNENFSGELCDIIFETGGFVKRLNHVVSSVRNYKKVDKKEIKSLRDFCKVVERADEARRPSPFYYWGFAA